MEGLETCGKIIGDGNLNSGNLTQAMIVVPAQQWFSLVSLLARLYHPSHLLSTALYTHNHPTIHISRNRLAWITTGWR